MIQATIHFLFNQVDSALMISDSLLSTFAQDLTLLDKLYLIVNRRNFLFHKGEYNIVADEYEKFLEEGSTYLTENNLPLTESNMYMNIDSQPIIMAKSGEKTLKMHFDTGYSDTFIFKPFYEKNKDEIERVFPQKIEQSLSYEQKKLSLFKKSWLSSK